MTIRTLLCSLILGLTASAALACSSHQKQAQSCIPGTIWDSESQSCVKEVNS